MHVRSNWNFSDGSVHRDLEDRMRLAGCVTLYHDENIYSFFSMKRIIIASTKAVMVAILVSINLCLYLKAFKVG